DLAGLDDDGYGAAGGLRAQRRDQALLGQQRRVDTAGQRAQVLQRRAELRLEVRDGRPDLVRVTGQLGEQAELDGQRDELLLGAVVQVPLDPAAFGVLGPDQPAPGRERSSMVARSSAVSWALRMTRPAWEARCSSRLSSVLL